MPPQPPSETSRSLGGERLPCARSCCGPTHPAIFHYRSICTERVTSDPAEKVEGLGGSAESLGGTALAKQLLPSPVGTGEPGPELVFTGSSRPGQVWLGPLHGAPVLHRHCDCPLGPALQIQTKVLLADDAVCTTWISAHLSPRLAPLCLQEQWVWESLFVFF